MDVIITPQLSARKRSALHGYITRTTRLKCAKCSAHTRNRREKSAIWFIIAQQINTVVYGGFGLVFNMGIIAYENEGDKNMRF